MSSGAREHGITVLGIDQNFRNVLRVVQSYIGPVLSAVRRFVNAISDRDAVSHPRLSRAHPYDLRIGRIDSDRANRLRRLPIEYRFEGRTTIDRFPDPSTCRAYEDV